MTEMGLKGKYSMRVKSSGLMSTVVVRTICLSNNTIRGGPPVDWGGEKVLWGWDSVATSALGDEKEGEGSRFRACSVPARLEARDRRMGLDTPCA
jgi:hypothetical protein